MKDELHYMMQPANSIPTEDQSSEALERTALFRKKRVTNEDQMEEYNECPFCQEPFNKSEIKQHRITEHGEEFADDENMDEKGQDVKKKKRK